MTGVTYQGQFPKTDYEVSLEAMRVDGVDFFCGMTFPVRSEFCTLIVGGWGGEVVATVVRESFDYLDSPPHRIGMGDHPLPFSNPLEEASRPTADRIYNEVRSLLAK